MVLKKVLLFILCSVVIFNGVLYQSVLADDVNEEPIVEVFTNGSKVLGNSLPTVNATAALVMDSESGRVLFEKNADTRKSIASTTKIMTAIIAIENGNLNDVVIVSKRAANTWGSSIKLKEGEKLTLRELLYGLMLKSGNDAAVAIAEHIGGSVEGFVSLMNKKALELNLKDTSFKTPHGLDQEGHYSTAYELAEITRYALKNPIFSNIVGTLSTSIPNRDLYNTNEMLGAYPGADGVKTGYTGQAGRCLVTSATRDGRRYISVVLGSPTRTIRAQNSKKILDYAFNNYKSYTLLKEGENIRAIPVIKGTKLTVPVEAVEELRFPLTHDEIDSIETVIDLPDSITAPIAGQIEVGTIEYLVNGKSIAKSALRTGISVPHKGFWGYLGEIFDNWNRMMREVIL